MSLVFVSDRVDASIEDVKNQKPVDFEYHLGGNVYVSVVSPYWLVDIRQRFQDSEGKLRPTARGIKLKFREWQNLKESYPEIQEAVPETETLVPCALQDDHQYQLGAVSCSECNPNGYQASFYNP
jgi:hypothetical protein